MAWKRVKYKKLFPGNALLLLFVAALIFHAVACAVQTKTAPSPGAPAVAAKAGKMSPPAFKWRSDEYIVLVLSSPATTEELAAEYLADGTEAWLIEDYNHSSKFRAGQEVVLPLGRKQSFGIRKDSFQVIPILCYHRFGDKIKNRLVISPDEFERQMSYLKKEGYRVITLSHLEAFLGGMGSLPEKAVVITIDDGYRSAYDIAFPVLKKHGFPATLFVYSDYISVGGNSLNWKEIQEMERSGLIETQSHTKSHADLTAALSGGEDPAREELVVPVDLISRKLGHPARYLAYPFGRTSPEVIELVSEARYKMALTVDRGSNAFFDDPFRLKRNMIFGGEGLDHFLENLSVNEKIER